jgi:hypothetical protein
MGVGKSISILALLLIGVGVLALGVKAFTKRSPVALKLGDWQNDVSRYEFTCPKGIAFRLLLGIPEGTAYDTAEVKGAVSVKEDGISILESRITTNDIMRTLWLSRQGLVGILITGYTNSMAESFRRLKPGKKVQIELSLTPEPPPKSSLWLYNLQ